MKLFLSSIESAVEYLPRLSPWNLVSIYYKPEKNWGRIIDESELVMVDSGAFSFQRGKTVDWDDYTQAYADFIRTYDHPKVVGYFEMDVDNRIGYERVLELRSKLEDVTDKIIPVWHKNRGFDDYVKTCKRYKRVAITTRREDLKPNQYGLFIRTAWDNGAQIHALAMADIRYMKKYPFNTTDAATWINCGAYGHVYTPEGQKRTHMNAKPGDAIKRATLSHGNAVGLQKYMFEYWRRFNESAPWEKERV